jgi:hypothetical protein
VGTTVRTIQNYGNGLCVRTTGSKDNSAVWA